MFASDFDEILGRIRGLVIGMGSELAVSESAEVDDLLDHAELGEALRTLAWLVVEEGKRITFPELAEIQLLALRMGMANELPPEFGFVGGIDRSSRP